MSSSDLLTEHVKEEIDGWRQRFPEKRQRSAIIGALRNFEYWYFGIASGKSRKTPPGR